MKQLNTDWQRKWIDLEVTHPLVQAAGSAAQDFCKRWIANLSEPSLLVLCGEPGTCKTHVAGAIHSFCSAAAQQAFDRGGWGARKIPATVYRSWPELANEFNDKKFTGMDDLLAADLLTLDDVGAENDPWKICADKLCQVLSKRERRFTVITTNILPEAWAETFDTRIADRFLRNSRVINLAGVPSYVMAGGVR